MTPIPLQKAFRQIAHLPIRAVIFFSLLFLYVRLRIDPTLVYHGLDWSVPPFLRGKAFFSGFVTYPGGLVDYLSACLSQFYFYSWIGALIITAAAGLLSLCTYAVIKAASGSCPRVLHYVPAILLLIPYNRYSNPLSAILGLLTALLCTVIYVHINLHSTRTRLIVFLLLSALLYYIAAGAYLLFAVLCGIFELLIRHRRLLGSFCFLCAAAIPYLIGIYVFRVRLAADAYGWLLPFHRYSDPRAAPLVLCVYLFFPAVALEGALGRRLATDAVPATGKIRSGLAAKLRNYLRKQTLQRTVASAALLVVAAPVVWFSFDDGRNTFHQVEYCARQHKWRRLLQSVSRLPLNRYTLSVNWHVNRALYHTGGLPYEMFSYPQLPMGLMPVPHEMVDRETPPVIFMQCSDVLVDLGRINCSEHLAHEALAFLGYRPFILQRIALIHAAKGRMEAARIVLGTLSRDLVYGKWAKRYLSRLETDPLLSGDEEVERMRSLMMDEDNISPIPFETMLQYLLESNRQNRMAFEYLMAYYLLTGQLEKAVQNIDRLDDFDYPAIPRHYEEAILLYTTTTGKKADLHGRRISPQTIQRFRHWDQLLARHVGDRRTALAVLARYHGNTYFFFYYRFVVLQGATE